MIQEVLRFAELLNRFRLIKRTLLVNGEDRRENDQEHSFALAMLAWHIAERKGLPLDRLKLMRYALAHDLVEVYAGDTAFFLADKTHADSKHQRERAAALRLEQEYPEFATLHETIASYEARADAESRFLYALDKLQPILNIYLDAGRTWKERGVSQEMLVSMKSPKIKDDPDIDALWCELQKLLAEDADRLFGKA
jgi:putative hydrolases of HD superfamily